VTPNFETSGFLPKLPYKVTTLNAILESENAVKISALKQKLHKKAAKAPPTKPTNDPHLTSLFPTPATAAEELLLDPTSEVTDAMADDISPPMPLVVVGAAVMVAGMTEIADDTSSETPIGLQPPSVSPTCPLSQQKKPSYSLCVVEFQSVQELSAQVGA
jgi:hypothetical protein